jgi:hypothetical protein
LHLLQAIQAFICALELRLATGRLQATGQLILHRHRYGQHEATPLLCRRPVGPLALHEAPQFLHGLRTDSPGVRGASARKLLVSDFLKSVCEHRDDADEPSQDKRRVNFDEWRGQVPTPIHG